MHDGEAVDVEVAVEVELLIVVDIVSGMGMK